MGVNMNASPGASGGPYLKLAVPDRSRPVAGYIGSRAVVGCMVHWDATVQNIGRDGRIRYGRTVPCRMPAHECGACERLLKRTWKGYLAVWQPTPQQWIVVQLTELAARQEPRLDPARAFNPRGYHITLTRGGPHSPMQENAILSEGPYPGRVPPDEPDVVAFLYRMWGIDPSIGLYHATDAPGEEIPLPGEADTG